jgi:hypothetical protein
MDQESKLLAAQEADHKPLSRNLFLFFTSTTGLMITMLMLAVIAIPASIVAGLTAKLVWWGLMFGWELL